MVITSVGPCASRSAGEMIHSVLIASPRRALRAWLARHVAAVLLTVTVCGLAVGGILRLAGAADAARAAWLAVGAWGLAYAFWTMADSLRRRRIGVDLIAVLALAGAIAVGELLAAAVIGVMLASGRALEGWAAGRAHRDLRGLLERAPRAARRYRGDELETVPVDLAEPGESTYAGIVRLVTGAEQTPAPFVRLADRYVVWFLFVTLAAAGATWAAAGAARAVAVLVVATPCPLILAAPVALVSGMSVAARHGVVVKGGGVPERLARCATLLMDKTGTLTSGRPAVTAILRAGRWDAGEILSLAASLDQVSGQVLASAVVRAARDRRCRLARPDQVEEAAGQGIRGTVAGHRVAVGKAAWCGVITGDRAEVAEAVGTVIGVDEVLAERTPDEKLQAVDAAITRRFQQEHEAIRPDIEELRDAADTLGFIAPAQAVARIRHAYRIMVGAVAPHEQAEERGLYPALDRILGSPDATATMSRGHAEIARQIRRLGQLLDDIGAEPPDDADIAELRSLLYGLHAILRLHTTQEDENYLSLGDNTGERPAERRAALASKQGGAP